MRKTVIAVGGLALASVVLLTSVLSQSGMVSWRSFHETKVAVEYSTNSAVLDTKTLPSAGWLPGNPFYLVKMVRDRVHVWLTRDPAQKAKLYISLAGKRTETAYHLAAKKQILLSQSTMMKAYQYMEAAIKVLDQQPQAETLTREIRRAMLDSLENHMILVTEMGSQVEGNTRIPYEKMIESYKVLWLSTQGKLGNEEMKTVDGREGYL